MRDVPYVKFWGDEYAKTVSAAFAEIMDDLLMKVDQGSEDYGRGFMHVSTLPHEGTCYYDQMWSRDAGRGAMELARWGYAEQAGWVVDHFLQRKNMGDHWGRIVNRGYEM